MRLKFLFLLSCFIFGSPFAQAGEVFVAVASNFASPMKLIATAFAEKTGHRLKVSYGSTGKFYAQIKSDAPFEVFLSADQEHPRRLCSEKLALAPSRFTYAIGRLALWSPKENLVDSKGLVLQTGSFSRLSLANPKFAPYGQAAKDVLKRQNLWESLERKLIYGENITQAFQFVATKGAELGFVAYSQIKRNPKGSYWLVPQDLYSPLKQDAVLLVKGERNPAARQFLEFLKGQAAKSIMADYGFTHDSH